ncbi:MAG: tetratricopeptide repeat protein [Roseivirga sp.]|nr:tetratricopeptide repeat protein [Roseivirga sp.]
MACKRFTLRFLLLTPLVLWCATVCAQNPRQAFNEKFNKALDLVADDPKNAIDIGFEAYYIARDSRDYWAMAIARAGIGYISYEVGDYKASYQNYVDALESLEKADTVDLSNKVIILNELSLIQSDFNNHDESIHYSKVALRAAKEYVKKYPDHAKENDQLRWLVDIPYYMAIEYQAKGAHQTAGKLLVDLWEQAEDKNDIVTYAQVLNELGIAKMNNAEFKDAQEYFGLVVSGQGVFDDDKSVAYHNLAYTYMRQGNLDKAESYYLIGLDMAKNLEDDLSQFITYQDLGELEHIRGNSEKAIEYWETGLSVYDQLNGDPELYSVYNWLQLAYMDIDVEKAKEFNKTYAQHNSFYVQNQAFQREEEAQNREELIRYIDEQRQNRVDAEQRNQFIQQFWPVFLGVALLVIFSIIMGIRYYRALRANRGLAQAQLNTQAAGAPVED